LKDTLDVKYIKMTITFENTLMQTIFLYLNKIKIQHIGPKLKST